MPQLSPTLERDRLLLPSEVSAYLNLALATVYTKAHRREIPSVKIGHALRFRLTDLERMVKAGARPALRKIEAPTPESEGQA